MRCCLLITAACTITHPSLPPSPAATRLQPCQPKPPCTHPSDESPTPIWDSHSNFTFPYLPERSPGHRRAAEKVPGMLHYPEQLMTRASKLCMGRGSRQSACSREGSKDCACSIYPVGNARPHRKPSCDTLPFTVRALQGRCLGTGTQASGSALPSCSLQIRLQQLGGHSASFPLPVPSMWHGGRRYHTHTEPSTPTQLVPFQLRFRKSQV